MVIVKHENDVGKLLFPLAISASHSVCCLSSVAHNKFGQLGFILSCSEFYFLTYLIENFTNEMDFSVLVLQ